MVRGANSSQKGSGVNKWEGGCNTARHSYPPKRNPEHAVDHRPAARGYTDPLPAGTEVIRGAQPTTLDGTSRHRSTI